VSLTYPAAFLETELAIPAESPDSKRIETWSSPPWKREAERGRESVCVRERKKEGGREGEREKEREGGRVRERECEREGGGEVPRAIVD